MAKNSVPSKNVVSDMKAVDTNKAQKNADGKAKNKWRRDMQST